MQIEFEPHPNEQVTDVQCVVLNGERVGYCGTISGRPVTFIRPVAPDVVTAVEAAVEKAVGSVNGSHQPPEIVEDEGADEDDNSDEE